MVCLYSTLSAFPNGKAFTCMILQAARIKQRPHTVGGLPSSLRPGISLSSSTIECRLIP